MISEQCFSLLEATLFSSPPLVFANCVNSVSLGNPLNSCTQGGIFACEQFFPNVKPVIPTDTLQHCVHVSVLGYISKCSQAASNGSVCMMRMEVDADYPHCSLEVTKMKRVNRQPPLNILLQPVSQN